MLHATLLALKSMKRVSDFPYSILSHQNCRSGHFKGFDIRLFSILERHFMGGAMDVLPVSQRAALDHILKIYM
jgi:hypothetical protein